VRVWNGHGGSRSFGDRERLESFCEREKETVREKRRVAAGEKRKRKGERDGSG
jgi:hypothetical protein